MIRITNVCSRTEKQTSSAISKMLTWVPFLLIHRQTVHFLSSVAAGPVPVCTLMFECLQGVWMVNCAVNCEKPLVNCYDSCTRYIYSKKCNASLHKI